MDEPTTSASITLYDYQQRAIDAWSAASFRGIFDMATGTGKTITALCAMVKCYEALQTGNKERARLAVFIVCPFRHLVEQWTEDVRRFGMKPIMGYGASAQTDWRRRLKFAIEDMKHGIKGREFLHSLRPTLLLLAILFKDKSKIYAAMRYLLLTRRITLARSICGGCSLVLSTLDLHSLQRWSDMGMRTGRRR